MTPKEKNIRFGIILGVTGMIFFLFIWRAWELSFHSPIPVNLRGEGPQIRRGAIYDQNEHELAISLNTLSVAIRPYEVVNKEQTIQLLSKSLAMPPAEIRSKLESEARFVWLKRKVPVESIRELRQIKLPGLVLKTEASRYYPNGRLASHVLGFTGLDNEGLAGIEYQFNNELTSASKKNGSGNHIYLTLDAYIQYHLEKALAEGMKSTGSKAAIGIISDVKTGRILAMASLPDFNPNNPLDYQPGERRNRAITENIEPGSTFKIFTLASLLKDNLINEEKTYYCPGYFKYKDATIHCTRKHEHQNIIEVLKNSCNTGVIEASWEMPVIRLYENLKYFGFGAPTEIALPGEEKGILHPPAKWDYFRKMTIPIGHGLAVTPIQLVVAGNSIANGGLIMRPLIIDRIVSPEGKILFQSIPQERFTSTSEKNAGKILSYLGHVVTRGGTGYLAAIPDIPIAGKTSTAQKYSEGKYQASFLGFFPGNEPEVSVYIWYDEPSGDFYQGGRVAAPVFKNVVQEIIPIIHKGKVRTTGHLSPVQRTPSPAYKNIMPNLLGKSKKEVAFYLWKHFPGRHKFIGKGYLTSQSPAPGTTIKEPYQFQLYFNEPTPAAP